MQKTPIITYLCSNTSLVDHLKNDIIANLPKEFIEWQRSYGRATRRVCLDAQLVPFKQINLSDLSKGYSADNKSSLFNRCFLHTFWFECSGVDVYKSTIREEVLSWMAKLREHEIWDLLIVVVDNSEKKSSAKKLLPRSTVLDKVRADFPSFVKDAAEKCITLNNPLKNGGSTDSYKFFFNRLRILLLKSFSRHLTRFEDYVRVQRESRNNKDWDFFNFFLLQEELAFAFESLSLFEDALVQYDELDALLSQFVINSHVSEMPNWLKAISGRSNVWCGLCLSRSALAIREKFKNSSANLVELRNYLFFRQCELLFLQNEPWEAASRALPFLQNCVSELKILEVKFPTGAVPCWVFLSALEILQTCERYKDSSNLQTYSKHSIGILSYARKKLEELGFLCGLMPGMSENIHQVVNLISGIGVDPYSDQIIESPQVKLKEALSKPESFLKVYLDFSELTISTFKHIGRYRSARLVGRELAFLYMRMNNHQQSVPFLLDLEKVFLSDRWFTLLTDIRKHILNCYTVIDDKMKILQYSLLLAASPTLNSKVRNEYMDVSKLTSEVIRPLPCHVDSIEHKSSSHKSPLSVANSPTHNNLFIARIPDFNIKWDLQ